MNTERPDNDDAAHEADAAETAGNARNTEETGGTAGEKGAEKESPEPEAAAESEAVPEPEAAPGPGAAAAPDPGAAAGPAAAPGADGGDGDGDGDGEPPAPDVTAGAGGDSPERAGRRSPLVVASVAAAVLLVGGGGAYFATTTASDGSGGSDSRTGSSAPGGDGTPPPLVLDGVSEGGNGIATGEPDPYGVTYRADGPLPDGPDSAPVYRAEGEVTQDEVARLAKALGIDGTPVVRGQAWQVGPAKDGAGPSLQVNKQAPGAWTFHRYAPGTDNCKSTLVCASDPANPAGDTVSEETAKKAAAPVLKAVGQDTAKVDASQVMGAQRVVNADPVIGGLPTYGWTTGLTVSADGEVVGGSGQVKAPAESDTYPVVSAQKTLELMNTAPPADPRTGIGGCASPVPLKDRPEAPCGESTSASTPTPQQETITVDDAVFGLAMHVVDGRPALVPSWLFTVKASGAQNSFTVTHPAVDPEYLVHQMPAGEPTDAPSPRPTGPGDEPTSSVNTREVHVDGYTAEGRELTVAFTGGVCAKYEASASETADEVTVTVTETSDPEKICIMIAKEFHQTVTLDAPLGDREVVGSDGKAIPLEKPGARLPETSGAR
ncbi:hypothetical protein [Streptomyces luteolifulvus]|uniref:hypothetical protein n=1 Tax=Streptomyces luteolifulvus TaxID=2615112 RepID=UPI0017824175|nr:hypothetical protein [Streptomyces luteolifulvus]